MRLVWKYKIKHSFCIGNIKNEKKLKKTANNNKQKFVLKISVYIDKLNVNQNQCL